jgi:hypothetical protein
MVTELYKRINKIEYILCFLVGITALNYLYVFKVFYSQEAIILLMMVVCFIFFCKSFCMKQFLYSGNTKLILSLFFLSALFGVLDFIINGNSPDFNDALRLVLYLLYFSWISFVFKKGDFDRFVYLVSFYSFLILGLSGLFQIYSPLEFSDLLFSKYSGPSGAISFRICGPLSDSNTFAGAIVLHVALIWELGLKRKPILFFLPVAIITTFLINVSGSRLGLIMFVMLGLKILVDRTSQYTFTLCSIFCLLACLLLFNAGVPKQSSGLSNVRRVDTVISRIIGDNVELAHASTQQREKSLYDSFRFAENYSYIWGPGLFNFKDAWQFRHYPHSGLFFLFSQFGLFVFVLILALRISWSRAKYIKKTFIFSLVLLYVSFLPNAVYYPLFFYILLFINQKSWFRNFISSLLIDKVKSSRNIYKSRNRGCLI